MTLIYVVSLLKDNCKGMWIAKKIANRWIVNNNHATYREIIVNVRQLVCTVSGPKNALLISNGWSVIRSFKMYILLTL